ncbi:DUF3139 domain-containing protein [Pseudobacillus badius]|uniref:DUF3139 domain-containing protein n=1 Tax=Bacillus badius TaxID=1455 RepID=UPI0007B09CC8|nr:DUF3139 domain-containing protein [Bacillus badius]KZN99648.1 hypothetical protein A4244_16745 [Bacillus badius]OCS85752.1 hypothetical protein A6M11_16760 [Bacillus badius]OVE51891.1 DUF3139 domain-containing protein [Bacillus badius]TDW03321.1 uncharacterized protein DUF3139 [Bacillus badius]UAT32169.1 DUF3139 domain-containing protein [Bacillus badius]
MAKKIFLSVFILLLMALGVYYVYWDHRVKNEEIVAKKALNEYLYEERAFQKSDIKKITFFNDNPLGGENYLLHYAYVAYTDEPENQYVYYITKDKKATFAGYAGQGDPDTMKHEDYEKLNDEKVEE